MPHRPVYIIVLLFALVVPVFSQGVDVRGVIADSVTRDRIPFANVIITVLNKGAASNINGFYLISNVDPGVYRISASSIGYVKQTKTVAIRHGEPTNVNFELVPQPVEFSEVVVTDKAKRELTEINTSIHVLEQRDIHAVPSMAQEDVFRAIQILPGIVSTSDVNSHFYVRGGGGDQNLILLDGMKIYNPFHALGIFSVFDPDVVKTTEVYTGAFPPGFGGRLSSVVSMTSRDGSASHITGRSNLNFVSSKLQLEGPVVEGVRFLASGRRSLFSNTLSRFLQKDLPLSFYDAFIKVTREGEENHAKYGFEGFYSGDDLVSVNAYEPNYSWRNHAIGLIGSGLLEDRIYIDAVGFENFFEARRDPKLSATTTLASTSVKEVGVRANATVYTDTRDLYFFGFEFSFPTMEYNLINTLGAPVRLYSSVVEAWMWIRYQATLGNFQLDGGIHSDIGSLFERSAGPEVIQPRLNVSYLLPFGWRAKASYGRFNQHVLSVNNEDDVISIFDAWITVPDQLKLESADHYVLGLEGNLFPTLSTSLQTYYKHYGSLVSYNRDKVDAQDPDYTNSTGEAYGFESLVRLGIPLVDCYAAYTFGKSVISGPGLTYAPRYDRRHNINLLTVFHPLEGFDVTFRWEIGSGFPFTQSVGFYDRLALTNLFGQSFVGETGAPYTMLGPKNAARLPWYHRLDLGLAYRFALNRLKGTIGVQVVNVYDHKNIFYFDRRTGQQINMLSFFPSAALTLEY